MEEIKFYVAGVQHHQYKQCLQELSEIELLKMVPEPDNRYDPNAIKLMFGEYQIGYVPKKFSAVVSAALEISNVECEIVKFDPNARPWEMIEVVIRSSEDENDEPDYLGYTGEVL